MTLPYQPDLPIHLLAAVFNSKVTTYKDYWFLAIISKVEKGATVIRKDSLFIEMIANAWFTVNYFHVSFGKQDRLQQAIEKIKAIEGLTIDLGRDNIIKSLSKSTNKNTVKELNYFNGEVPHRFLSPWFRAEDSKLAYEKSQSFTNGCLYALYSDEVIINPIWVEYPDQTPEC